MEGEGTNHRGLSPVLKPFMGVGRGGSTPGGCWDAGL